MTQRLRNKLSLALLGLIGITALMLWAAFPREEQASAATEAPYIQEQAQQAPELQEPTSDELSIIAKVLWGECRGVQSTMERAAVVWCILNRVDDPRWPNTIEGVCISSQFHGYSDDNPVEPELFFLAQDVYTRWQLEKAGEPCVARVLPAEYVFFGSEDGRNYFRTEYDSFDDIWDWSLYNPYNT